MLKKHRISEITSNLNGEDLSLAGWVDQIRDLGGIRFFSLRDRSGKIQVTAKEEKSPEEWDKIGKLAKEDVVTVRGTIKKSKQAPEGREIIPEKIEIINKSKSPLPVDPTGKITSELDTRLEYRFLDFRTPKVSSIFKIQNQIIKTFREYLRTKDFFEIQPPGIIASASEGGAELFPIPYFEQEAFLAQSPQLYKQMCAISFERVFSIMPVWRAEKFNRPTHLNEIRQMDIEVAFVESEEDVMKILEDCFVTILKNVKENCKKELEILGRDYVIPKLPLKRVTYTEAVDILNESGEEMEWGDDFSKPQERKLYELIGKTVFFIKDWPTKQKAFYAMPYEDNPKIARAFDLVHEGLEINSGTQRVHIPELLEKRIKEKGLNPRNFEYYIKCFRYGAPPHAGWSIGLERITATIAGMKNIRETCMFPRDRNRLTP